MLPSKSDRQALVMCIQQSKPMTGPNSPFWIPRARPSGYKR